MAAARRKATTAIITPPLELTSVQIPYYFRCPISLELMQDPVTLSTGQTYDRSSIESWVATGNDTCPVTRAPLTDFTLIPNHTLRRLIQEWCVAHRSQGVERIPTPKQPADPSLIRLLISQSTSSNDLSSRLAALRRIRSLARESDKNRSVISSLADARALIIEIAFENLDSGSDLSAEALAVLAMFSLTEAEGLGIVMAAERLGYLTAVMADESVGVDMRVNAGAVVEAAVTAARVAEVKTAVGAVEGVMEAYVWMVRQRESVRGVRIGIRGLFCLCLGKENRRRAVEAGAVAAVMRRLGELKEGELERGLAAVELMCRVEGGMEAVVKDGAAVGALVRAMRAGDRAAEHAAGVLVAVVGGSEGMQREAVEMGVVRELLVMVQGGGSERAKRKAQVLLKLVRAAWGETVERDVGGESDDFYFHHYW